MNLKSDADVGRTVSSFTMLGGISNCNRGVRLSVGFFRLAENQWIGLTIAHDIRTNRIGNDFAWWFGIGDDRGGAEAGGH